jgi:hypothetical protein
MVGKLAALSHTTAHLNAQPAVRFLLAHLPVIYPYAVAATALGYLSHLVLDSLTAPIPWGWPFAHRRLALAPAALRIRIGSPIETWLLRPAITIAAILAFLEGRSDPYASALRENSLPRACTGFAVSARAQGPRRPASSWR